MIELIEHTRSTNTALMERLGGGETLPHLYTLCTFRQTAGRGQRGNSWESEPDQNISFSTVLDTHSLPSGRLWRLSMHSALSVCEALRSYGLDAQIKWPNDVYVGDRKICGILVENVLQGGAIRCSITGIGVNVNQEVFVSDAPNPTSMRLQTGAEYDKLEVLERILDRMQALWPLVLEESDSLHRLFMARLYRREGLWPWREVASGVAPMAIQQTNDGAFLASIVEVNDDGCLVLRKQDGTCKAYKFKEIKYIIA